MYMAVHVVVFCCIWLYMAVYGFIWLIWLYMAVYMVVLVVSGCFWLSMAVYGCIWRYMVVHGCIWRYMVVCGVFACDLAGGRLLPVHASVVSTICVTEE